tara:strand:- start:43 stop:1728 length:1686 start_codon:yes stop_codon:yes gene_type:complete
MWRYTQRVSVLYPVKTCMPFRHVITLAALFLVLYLPGLATTPPLDRDEPRFMQASKQMLETGDYVDIRFQEEPRYKKPALIYWMQAGSVKLFAGGDKTALWAYRVPSVLGAVLAVIFTYLTAVTLAARPVAIVAAGVLASSILLTAEAHIAKTDAMLLAAITAGQYVLAALYRGDHRRHLFPLFWVALGAGVMLKGPVALVPAIATVAGLAAWDRSLAWAKPLRPLFGIPLMLAVTLPWLIAIIVQSDGHFLQKAVVEDMLNKVGGGVESHGMPPGYYLAILALTFWPGSLFLPVAVAGAWVNRAEKPVRFLICWALPVWLMFELIPTKLPHYTLPIFPALAILTAMAVTDTGSIARHFERRWSRIWGGIWLFLGIVLAIGLLGSSLFLIPPVTLAIPDAAFWSAGLAALAVALFSTFAYWRGAIRSALMVAVVGAAGLYVLIFAAALPALQPLWVSTRLAAAVSAAVPDRSSPVFIAGFGEPSAVFLLGTDTRHGSGVEAARYLDAVSDGVALVEARHREAFLKQAESLGLQPEAGVTISGLNYSRGDPVAITLYVAAHS